jgi:hypothetical protein
MAMGIVSDSDFDKEKKNLNIVSDSVTADNEAITGEVINGPTKGRGTDNKGVPDGLRKIIGEESATNGRQSAIELAESFGISASSVSAYGVGAHSTASYDERPNGSHINRSKERVAKRARGKLIQAINGITKEKLDITNAKDLAGIAKDMAAVIKVMEPEVPAVVNDNGPKFVFYAPTLRKETNYEVVQAKE